MLLGLLELLQARPGFLALGLKLQGLAVLFGRVGALSLLFVQASQPFASGSMRGPVAAIRCAGEIGLQIALGIRQIRVGQDGRNAAEVRKARIVGAYLRW